MLNPYLHKSSCFQSAIKETSRSQNKMGRTPIKPQKVVKKRVTSTKTVITIKNTYSSKVKKDQKNKKSATTSPTSTPAAATSSPDAQPRGRSKIKGNRTKARDFSLVLKRVAISRAMGKPITARRLREDYCGLAHTW